MLARRIPGTLVEASISGQRVRFFVHNPSDVIQRHHLDGEFYEVEELALMAKYLTPETRYLDVGANVGNHVVYLAIFSGLKNIVVVEPNGQAIAILQMNLALNGLEGLIDGSCLGYGLSDQAGRGEMVSHKDNLGGARFLDRADGPFELKSGDELLAGRTFDFIKIDTEGMEVKCLLGMERLIGRCRPIMFVEVDDANLAAFMDWCRLHRYVVRERFRRYTANENYLIAPA